MPSKNSIMLRGEIRSTKHPQFSGRPEKETPSACQETSSQSDAGNHFGAGSVSGARSRSSGKQNQIKSERPLKVLGTPAED